MEILDFVRLGLLMHLTTVSYTKTKIKLNRNLMLKGSFTLVQIPHWTVAFPPERWENADHCI